MRYFKLSAACSGLVLAGIARAGTISWDGNGDTNAGGSFGTGTNWVGDVAPGTGDIGSLVAVAEGFTRIVTIDANTTVQGIIWNQPGGTGLNVLQLNANLTLTNAANNAYQTTGGGWCRTQRVAPERSAVTDQRWRNTQYWSNCTF